MNNHSLQNTKEEPIALGSTPAAPAAHTRYLSSPAGATLHGKTQGFLPRLSPKQSPCHIHAAMTMRFATSGSQPASLDAHGNTERKQSCSHYTAICNRRIKKRIELRTREQQLIAEHKGGTNRAWFDPSRTRRTRGTFHRRPEPLYTEKHKVSCPGFPPKRSPCNIHAAITMRFATSSSQPASLDAHGNTKRQRSCSHYTAICNQRVKKRIELRTREQPLIAELQGGTNRAWFDPQPHPPHTRGTFHRRPELLYAEKHKVSCPGFPPKRSPCNIHAAITMRFATSGSQPASLDARGNTKRQQSCSHYTVICNQRVKKRIELRTREQPLIAEHKGGTNRAWFDPSRTRRTHEVPFIAGRSYFTRKNTRFPAPAFPQNEAHVTSMQPLQCVLQLQVPNPHLSTHMATQNDNDHAAITLRSATRESRNA